MYGFTVTSPYTLVMEYTNGSLEELLREYEEPFDATQLIDSAYSLARALQYLQNEKFIHGKIRCSSLKVIKYNHPDYLVIRLGDSGLEENYSDEE